jgi:hypothetical protein
MRLQQILAAMWWDFLLGTTMRLGIILLSIKFKEKKYFFMTRIGLVMDTFQNISERLRH